MGKVVMYASVSVDGFIADENDDPGALFDWLVSGDVPLDASGALRVSQASYDYTRQYWNQIAVTVVGRHVFDMTGGWDGKPPVAVDHVVVVTHRPAPTGWDGKRRSRSLVASRRLCSRRESLRATVSSRWPRARWVARPLLQAWWTRCAWT